MSHKGRLSSNLIANVAGFAVNAAVGVFLTPYLIRHLGVGAYGVVPLATTISSYLTVLTLVINATVARFVTVSLEQGRVADASRYFNTSLFASFAVAAALVLPAAWVAAHPADLLRVPPGNEWHAGVLLACTSAVVIVSVISAPFEVSTFCRNRFDVRNAIGIASTIFRVGLIVVAFSSWRASVAHVGVAALAAAIVSLVASVLACKRLTPELTIDRRHVDLRSLRDLLRSGPWVAISQLGTLLLLSIDLLVVNRMFGADASGRYASLLQWPILLRSIGLTLAGVLTPTMVTLYAKGDNSALVTFGRTAVKSLGLAVALPVGLIGGLSPEILRTWLGEAFVPLAPLLTLMVLPLSVNLGYLPLHSISMATNQVRLPGIVQVLAGAANLACAIWLAGPAGLGLYGVAGAGIAILTLRNVLFTPVYGALLIQRPLSVFMREVPTVLFASLCVAGAARVFAHLLPLASWPALLIFGGLFSAAYVALVWRFVVTAEERRFLRA